MAENSSFFTNHDICFREQNARGHSQFLEMAPGILFKINRTLVQVIQRATSTLPAVRKKKAMAWIFLMIRGSLAYLFLFTKFHNHLDFGHLRCPLIEKVL